MRYAREATAKRPDWYFNHLLLSACLSAAGDVNGGRASLATALSGRGYTLQSFQFGHPFVQARHRDKFLTALSNAGWEP